MHPFDLLEAMETFLKLFGEDQDGSWNVAVNPDLIVLDDRSDIWIKLKVAHINGNVFSVPVYVFN